MKVCKNVWWCTLNVERRQVIESVASDIWVVTGSLVTLDPTPYGHYPRVICLLGCPLVTGGNHSLRCQISDLTLGAQPRLCLSVFESASVSIRCS